MSELSVAAKMHWLPPGCRVEFFVRDVEVVARLRLKKKDIENEDELAHLAFVVALKLEKFLSEAGVKPSFITYAPTHKYVRNAWGVDEVHREQRPYFVTYRDPARGRYPGIVISAWCGPQSELVNHDSPGCGGY